jgi:hypothetical protein
MDAALIFAPVFLTVVLPATTAMSMILVLACHSFTRRRWASRRGLAAYVAFGLLGYLASLAYYAIVGTPSGSSSMFNLALLGAFFGSGYGGTAAWIYFERHRNNPMRSTARVSNGVA